DALAFVSTPACGCFEIEARVKTQQNTGNGAIAGLCVRDCLQPYGGRAVIAVTPGNGVNFYYGTHNSGVSTINGVPAATVRKYTLSSKALMDKCFEAQNERESS
ncbi:MAG: hypothetical protein ACREBW_01635, partial [Candidatus Micrarchaeaceae archaeon]